MKVTIVRATALIVDDALKRVDKISEKEEIRTWLQK